MKYDQFLANAARALSDSRKVKEMISGMQTALSAVPDMVRKNERLEKEIRKLKAENAGLKAELDDGKGNAEGFEPDAYMKLPLDADGEPIRIGDKMDVDGDIMNVLGYRLLKGELLLIAKKAEGDIAVYTPKPSKVRHFKYARPDSWEKLEADANLGLRDYCERYRLDECDYNMRMHMLARAKKLAGIEEEAER